MKPGEGYNALTDEYGDMITFGIIAAEVAIYIAVVKTFPILEGPVPAKKTF